eukprot:12325662-Alexandrium_andersonii.AAC.1
MEILGIDHHSTGSEVIECITTLLQRIAPQNRDRLPRAGEVPSALQEAWFSCCAIALPSIVAGKTATLA